MELIFVNNIHIVIFDYKKGIQKLIHTKGKEICRGRKVRS